MNLAEKSSIISTNNVTIAENEQRVYEAGKTKGIEQGKQAEYDAFWDAFQAGNPNSYNHSDYAGAFGGPCWNDKTFTPKNDIIPTNAQQMFWNTSITDLVAAAERQGIKIDFSLCSSLPNTFHYANCTRLGEISVLNCTLGSTFSYTSKLHTIEKMIVNINTVFSSTFAYSTALMNIIFEGVIGKNGLNFQWSPLTIESLRSIISCLKDYSTDTSGTQWVVTVGSTNLAKLTDDDLDNIEAKGWNFV